MKAREFVEMSQIAQQMALLQMSLNELKALHDDLDRYHEKRRQRAKYLAMEWASRREGAS